MAKKYLHFFSSKPKKTPPKNVDVVNTGPTEFSPKFTDPPADIIRASRRFFVDTTPTGSLIEEAWISSATSASSEAVVTESADPCADFRRSMEEMVDARRHVDGRGPLDWEYLEEMLWCYLELNDSGVHECLLRAFIDLTESLRRQCVEIV